MLLWIMQMWNIFLDWVTELILKKKKKEKNPYVLTDALKKYPFETDGSSVFKNNLKIKIFIADGYKQPIESNWGHW